MRRTGKGPRIVSVATATADHPRHSEPAVLERHDGSLSIQNVARSEMILRRRGGSAVHTGGLERKVQLVGL